jgi:1,2-diacylglycerol 3-alpha-glucosyltransferase
MDLRVASDANVSCQSSSSRDHGTRAKHDARTHRRGGVDDGCRPSPVGGHQGINPPARLCTADPDQILSVQDLQLANRSQHSQAAPLQDNRSATLVVIEEAQQVEGRSQPVDLLDEVEQLATEATGADNNQRYRAAHALWTRYLTKAIRLCDAKQATGWCVPIHPPVNYNLVRLLHIAHEFPPARSGIAQLAFQTSARLASRGHEVHVFTGHPAGTPSREDINGVHVQRFDVSGNAVFGIRGNPAPFVDAVLQQTWDLVCLFCVQTWNTDILLPRLSEIRGRKVLATQGMSTGDARFGDYYRQFAEQARAFSAIISPSRYLEEVEFAATHHLAPVDVIPNGVDTSAVPGTDTNRAPPQHDRPRLLTVSNHNPHKGHGRLWPLMRAVRRSYSAAELQLIGGSYPAARYRLGRVGVRGGCWYTCKARAATSDLVKLRASIPHAEVLPTIRGADILVVPSSWEASPLVVIDAMAVGTPWVAFDVGAIRDNAGGIVVDTIEEMADVVVALLADPARREGLGTQGRRQVLEQHDWDRVTDRWERVYERVTKP